MSDFGDFLGDTASSISGALGNAANSVGDFFGNMFGSSSSSAPDSGLNYGAGGSSSNTAMPTAQTANFLNPQYVAPSSSSSVPNVNGGDQAFLGQQSAVSNGPVDPSFSGTGPNTNSVLSTANTNPQGAIAPTSTTDQISNALGLGKTTSGDFLKAGVAGGGLLYNLLQGNGDNSAEKAIKNAAASQNAQGQQLQSYINNGTLPPGAQAYVDQQTAAQKAAIRSQYAANGESGSTAETQALNNVDVAAQAQMFQIATSLLNSGISETGASSQLYNYLMSAQNADQAQVGSAIQNFVSALGGGDGGTKTLKLTV